MKENKLQFIAITAMAVALTYVFTAFVNVRLPIAANGGLIHLGNVPLFIMAILFGKKTGAIAGGVGMGLFDLLSGWTAWAPFTFIIVGIMGYVVGAMTEKHDQYGWKVAAIFAAFVIKIVGYYIDGTEEKGYESPADADRSNGKLVMATNAAFEPYEYYEDNKIVGVDVDFAQAIADKLGMELTVNDMEFDSIIAAVDSGKADFGAAGMTVTKEREKQVDFSDSYYTGKQMIIVKK